MSRRNRPGEALKLGTTGGLGEENSHSPRRWKNSTLFLRIPVLFGPGPGGPSFPSWSRQETSSGTCLGCGDVLWLLQLRGPVCLSHLGGAMGGVGGVKSMGVRW